MPEEIVADSVLHNASSAHPGCSGALRSSSDAALAAASPSLVSQSQKFHNEHWADDPMQDPNGCGGILKARSTTSRSIPLMGGRAQICGLAPFLREGLAPAVAVLAHGRSRISH